MKGSGVDKLYCELCSHFKFKKGVTQEEIYKILSKYDIRLIYTSLSVSKLINTFLKSKESEYVSVNTLWSYRNNLELFSDWLKSNKVNINNITKQSLNDFISFLERRRLSSSSINLAITVVKVFLDFLDKEDIIQLNPCSSIKYKKSKITRHSLTSDEVNKIRKNFKNIREEALIEFMLSSGCRVSEICEIRYQDIDFKNNIIKVTGKGNKERVVMFNNKAKSCIQKNYKKSKNKEYLFSGNKYPYKKLSRFAVEKIVREVGERCGLDHSLHPHLFRHTFATEALNKGMDIVSIQKLLGHDSLSTTQIYAELSNKRLNEQYNKIMN